MYLVISLLVLRAGCGIWLYQFLIIAYLFTLCHTVNPYHLYPTDFLWFLRINTETVTRTISPHYVHNTLCMHPTAEDRNIISASWSATVKTMVAPMTDSCRLSRFHLCLGFGFGLHILPTFQIHTSVCYYKYSFSPWPLFFGKHYQLSSSRFQILAPVNQESVRSITPFHK